MIKESVAFEDSIIFALSICDKMTKTELKILSHFVGYFSQKPSEFWVSHNSICKKIGCDPKTISRFLKKYCQFLFHQVHQPVVRQKGEKPVYLSNTYKPKEKIFTHFKRLCRLGFLKDWKTRGKRLLSDAIEDENKVISLLENRVMNTKMSDGKPSKCPTNNFINNSKKDIGRKTDQLSFGDKANQSYQVKAQIGEPLLLDQLRYGFSVKLTQMPAWEVEKAYWLLTSMEQRIAPKLEYMKSHLSSIRSVEGYRSKLFNQSCEAALSLERKKMKKKRVGKY